MMRAYFFLCPLPVLLLLIACLRDILGRETADLVAMLAAAISCVLSPSLGWF